MIAQVRGTNIQIDQNSNLQLPASIIWMRSAMLIPMLAAFGCWVFCHCQSHMKDLCVFVCERVCVIHQLGSSTNFRTWYDKIRIEFQHEPTHLLHLNTTNIYAQYTRKIHQPLFEKQEQIARRFTGGNAIRITMRIFRQSACYCRSNFVRVSGRRTPQTIVAKWSVTLRQKQLQPQLASSCLASCTRTIIRESSSTSRMAWVCVWVCSCPRVANGLPNKSTQRRCRRRSINTTTFNVRMRVLNKT